MKVFRHRIAELFALMCSIAICVACGGAQAGNGSYTAPVISANTTPTVTGTSPAGTTNSGSTVSVAAPAPGVSGTSSGPALYVATTGSDSNNCSSGAPCQTIAHATTVAIAGTTIHVAAGTYTGDFTTSTSGTSSAPLTITCDSPLNCKLVGNGGGQVWALNASYNIIKGFDISGGSGDTLGMVIGWSGSGFGHDQFLGNYIHDFDTSGCNSGGGAAIDTGQGMAGYNTIVGNRINNMAVAQIGNCPTVQGIYISSTNDYVADNLVSNVAAGGIQQWHGTSDSVIINNTVFHCAFGIIMGDGDGGALPGGSANNVVANNIVVFNSYGIDEMGTMGPGNSYIDNLVYSNSVQDLIISTTTPTGTINASPLFVNYQTNGTGDYHLSSGSPAISAGTLTSAPATDFGGTPQTSPPSIGAYAYPL